MPDSFGKRARRDVKARKAVAREERRLARAQRREDRAAGLIDAGPPIAPSEDEAFGPQPGLVERDREGSSEES